MPHPNQTEAYVAVRNSSLGEWYDWETASETKEEAMKIVTDHDDEHPIVKTNLPFVRIAHIRIEEID